MKKLTWKIKEKELLNDIEGLAYKEGYVMPDDTQPNKHDIIDILTDGNKELVARTLDLAAAEVNEILYPYTKKDIEEGNTADDTLYEISDYVFALTVPDTFSETSERYAILLIHEFMVCRALADFLSIGNPDASSKYFSIVENIGNKIRLTMSRRGKRVRISQHPF